MKKESTRGEEKGREGWGEEGEGEEDKWLGMEMKLESWRKKESEIMVFIF